MNPNTSTHIDSSVNNKPCTTLNSISHGATDEELSVSWQQDLGTFLKSIGLTETRRCLETELLVLSQYHQSQLPEALEKLVDRLLKALERHIIAKENELAEDSSTSPTTTTTNGLLYTKKRKRQKGDGNGEDGNTDNSDSEAQELVKLMDPEQVQIRASDNQVQQRINTYIQAKQHDVDASNRAEFLNRPDPKGEDVTCARADAREINRNIQMKFDIVNNEDGPLARSLISSSATTDDQRSSNATDNQKRNDQVATEVMEERLGNLEAHLNVQFEKHATKPFTWTERISILERTLMDIERKYPTWAAVHFNQPNRTYPPPPPVTLIARSQQPQSPSSTSAEIRTSHEKNMDYVASQLIPQQQKQTPSPLKLSGRSNSSLTRTVLEQLQRQKQLQSHSTPPNP
ncbi:hypothetical protein BCR42DRAFT_407804 [Absidia repens]|uniref:Uncharacterized protein n=1 Tax=Absidia repens TaxID=90262 RepID=A0A1X2ISU1_9FUNG|nr:hypothetical protein BCR42DRAFT_407804 [Absidia repens]